MKLVIADKLNFIDWWQDGYLRIGSLEHGDEFSIVKSPIKVKFGTDVLGIVSTFVDKEYPEGAVSITPLHCTERKFGYNCAAKLIESRLCDSSDYRRLVFKQNC